MPQRVLSTLQERLPGNLWTLGDAKDQNEDIRNSTDPAGQAAQADSDSDGCSDVYAESRVNGDGSRYGDSGKYVNRTSLQYSDKCACNGDTDINVDSFGN